MQRTIEALFRKPASTGEVTWLNRTTWRGDTCPNCGNPDRKERRLRVVSGVAGADGRPCQYGLLICRACSAGYFAPPPAPDYAAAPGGGGAALSFYLEQGAGTWGMAALLMSLGLPPGTRMVEVGCGFGFALDFARRALGWEVVGFDPSPFARIGAETLGLEIHPELFEPGGATTGDAYDVVLASEMLEHVEDPFRVAARLRAALSRSGGHGVFVLTTPDVASARRSTPPGLLTPLLSAGYHTILQSWQSLEHVLWRAGFADVEVRQNGPSLVARACVGKAPAGQPPDRAVYERWLVEVADASIRPDLRLGMLARAYRARIAAGEPAADLFSRLQAECLTRFQIDLDAPATAAIPSRAPIDLGELLEREPACHGPLLLARAHERLRLGARRSDVVGLLEAAVAAAGRLRAALNTIGSDDGDSESVAWSAAAELVLAAAEQDAPGTAARLRALPVPAPAGADRFLGIARRCFVILVNDGSFEQAGDVAPLVGDLDSLATSRATPDADGLDALFCAATFELQTEGGNPARAVHLLEGLRRHVTAEGAELPTRWQPIVEAETLARAAAGMERPTRSGGGNP